MSKSSGAERGPNVVVGPGCRFNGKLELEGESQIHGSIEGEIRSRDELIIGEKANIEAILIGSVIKIFGKVNGDINCSERLELHPGASVTGNLFSPSLVIREGVVFEGRCSMRSLQPDVRSGNVLELRPSQMADPLGAIELKEGNA